MSRLSRRNFARGVVTGTLAVAGAKPVISRDQQQQSPEDTGLSPNQTQEIDARFNEVIRRYGDRLSDEQRRRVRRILMQNERMLAPIRDFEVKNGDTPATTLKLHVEEVPSDAR